MVSHYSRIPELEFQSKEFVHAKSTAHRCWCSLARSNAVNCLVWRWTRSAASMPYMWPFSSLRSVLYKN